MEKSWLALPPESSYLRSTRISIQVTLTPNKLCDCLYKQFISCYLQKKIMRENIFCPGWLGMEGDPPTRDTFSPCTQALTLAHTLNSATRSESPLSGSMVFKMRNFSGNSRTTNSVLPHVTYSIRASWINIYCACETNSKFTCKGKSMIPS